MLVSGELLRSYPKLSVWLIENIPKVVKKTKIFNAFTKYSEQNSKDARSSLLFSTMPTISFRVMTAYGEFEGEAFPNTIFLAKSLCDKFEHSAADSKDARLHLMLEATVLHEMVHWGDWKDGVDQADEEGLTFETAAYGKVIGQYW